MMSTYRVDSTTKRSRVINGEERSETHVIRVMLMDPIRTCEERCTWLATHGDGMASSADEAPYPTWAAQNI